MIPLGQYVVIIGGGSCFETDPAENVLGYPFPEFWEVWRLSSVREK
jgi:hypothetical protein